MHRSLKQDIIDQRERYYYMKKVISRVLRVRDLIFLLIPNSNTTSENLLHPAQYTRLRDICHVNEDIISRVTV